MFKPLTMSILVVLAIVAGEASTAMRALVVLGAIGGLIGDVALLSGSTKAFLTGLTAFLVGHALYAVAALSIHVGPWAIVGLLFIGALLAWRFVPHVVPNARKSGGTAMMWAVLTYAGVIAVMVMTAFGTGRWSAAFGASLFACSDWVLGQRRFVDVVAFPRLAVMVPYHVGQTLLILGLLGVL